MAIKAGSAIGALDAVVRRQEKWAGAWRQRPALAAAAVTARQVGRIEADLLTEDSLAAVAEAFGYARDDEAVGELADELRRLAGAGAVEQLTGAFLAADRHGASSGRDCECP